MRYSTYDYEVTARDRNTLLVRSREGDASHTLQGPEARLFRLCGEPRSLEAHARAAVESLLPDVLGPAGGDSGGADARAAAEWMRRKVEGWLEGFVAAGLLTAEGDVARRVAERSGGADPPRVASVGIPTRDRPALVQRALSSLLRNDEAYGRGSEFVVADDGDAKDRSDALRAELGALARQHGRTLRFASRARTAAFADTLARHAGVPEPVVRFALLGDPRAGGRYGAVRNVLLLDTLGELSVHTDDDTVCTLSRLADRQEGLEVTPVADPGVYLFVDDWAEVADRVEGVEADLLAAHEAVLGLAPADCVAAALLRAAPVSLRPDSACMALLSRPGARVTATLMGTRGDCEGPGPQGTRALIGGPSFAWLVSDERRFRARLLSRRLVKCARRYSVSSGPYFAAISYGVDNRGLQPPFIPVQTAEDTLFGYVRRGMDPGSCTAFLPYAIAHQPDGGRPNLTRPAPFTHLANAVVRDLVVDFLVAWPESGPAAYLEALGAYLRQLGSLPERQFRSRVERKIKQSMLADAAQWEEGAAQRGDAPEYWRSAVRELVAAQRDFICSSTPASPDDLAGTAADRQALLQAILRQYGQMLACWPAVVGAARELRERGERPSVVVTAA